MAVRTGYRKVLRWRYHPPGDHSDDPVRSRSDDCRGVWTMKHAFRKRLACQGRQKAPAPGAPKAAVKREKSVVSRVLLPLGPKAMQRQSCISDRRCRRSPATYPGVLMRRAASAPLFGLAPGGVYPATPVTRSAVSSYLTISPLPRYRTSRARRYIFCGTFRGITPPGR